MNSAITKSGRKKTVYEVLELCCFEWFQNPDNKAAIDAASFRAVLFRMVPKLLSWLKGGVKGFRAVLFRMVPKPNSNRRIAFKSFRAVLFRMVPKLMQVVQVVRLGFRAVLFRMVPKQALNTD